MTRWTKSALKASAAALALSASPLAAVTTAQASTITSFTAGDLVVTVEGDGGGTGSYLDNQAAPLTLYEFTPSNNGGALSANLAGSFVLPQTGSGANSPISGEYGSSSEGTLQLSGNGEYLTLMGYGVNANSYNSTQDVGGTGTALAQSSSSSVPRVVALIGANGSVNTTTALTNVFNGNNPRSAWTQNGTSFYVSGQGTSGDTTGGVFTATLGAHTATQLTGADTVSNGVPANQDTRVVQQYNGQTYVSIDSKQGSGHNRAGIFTIASNGTLTALPGMTTGKVTLNGSNGNSVNHSSGSVDISPDGFFFANADTLYVADTGSPKIGSTLGDGGLQKWSLTGSGNSATWVLDYTLSSGLNLVANTAASGSTGLYALTGEVVGGNVELFATNYTIGDTDQTYLYGITDALANLSAPSNETFYQLAVAPNDTTFKGVSFAPVSPAPLPGSLPMFLAALLGVAGLGVWKTRRNTEV